MSLEQSMRIALAGIQVAQTKIAVTSLNIDNSVNPEYAKRIVVVDSLNPATEGGGVEVKAIIRNIDPYWLQEIRDQSSYVSYSKTINDYLEKVQLFQGSLSKNGDIDTTLTSKINDFMNDVKHLTTDAASESLMKKVVFSANMVSNTISNTAKNYQSLRFQADQEILRSCNKINGILQTIHDLNSTIRLQSDFKDENLAILEEQRDNLLKTLAEEIEINTFFNDDNTIYVTTRDGKNLLNESLYKLEYNALGYVEQLITDEKFDNINVYRENSNSHNSSFSYTLIQGGKRSEIVPNNYNKGKLQALLHIRDELLPTFAAQLDLLANTLTHKFNKIQNTGTGFPGLKLIQAARPMSLNEERIYQGILKMGVVDLHGQPVKYLPDAVGNSAPCYPLDLDFSKLNIGKGAGFIDVQTIINEINEYFYYSPVLSKTSLGNIEDIKIAATSNLATSPNGVFKFDFELSNKSQTNTKFEVQSIKVYDSSGTLVPGALTSTLPSAYTSLMGERSRTGQEIVVDFSPSLGSGPYTIQAEIQTTDPNGDIAHSLIDYKVDDTPLTPPGLNIRNSRYIASVTQGDGIIHPPVSTQRFAKAKLVDANGIEITSLGTPGYLVIETTEDNFFLSFDDLSSKEMGRPDQNTPSFLQGVEATGHGFGHFIGLNDFFVKHHEIPSSAINMKVRKEILNDVSTVSRGRLVRSPSITSNFEIGIKAAEGTISFSNQPSPGDTIIINGQTFTFQPVAGGNNEITLGPDLPSTLNNIVYTLSQTNNYITGIIDNANYISNSMNSLIISHKIKGTIGNKFTLSANLSIPAQINDSPYSTNPSGKLTQGETELQPRTYQPWTYEVGEGANSVINNFADLAFNAFDFESYGNLQPARASFLSYTKNIIAYSATETTRSKTIHQQQVSFLKAAEEKFSKSAGVQVNTETFDLTQHQQYFQACAKVIQISHELFQELIKSF